MAREKATKGDISMKSSSKSLRTATNQKKKQKGDDDDDYASKIGDFASNEPPEPEVLLSILHRKSKN